MPYTPQEVAAYAKYTKKAQAGQFPPCSPEQSSQYLLKTATNDPRDKYPFTKIVNLALDNVLDLSKYLSPSNGSLPPNRMLQPLNPAELGIIKSCFKLLENIGVLITDPGIAAELFFWPKEINKGAISAKTGKLVELPFLSDEKEGRAPFYLLIYMFEPGTFPPFIGLSSERFYVGNKNSSIRRTLRFIGLQKGLSERELMLTFLHEFGHFLGLNHHPLSYSTYVPDCMFDIDNPGGPGSIEASINLAREMNCSLSFHDRDQSSIMFCAVHQSMNNRTSIMTEGDKKAFRVRYKQLVKPVSTLRQGYHKFMCDISQPHDVCGAIPVYGDGQKVKAVTTIAPESNTDKLQNLLNALTPDQRTLFDNYLTKTMRRDVPECNAIQTAMYLLSTVKREEEKFRSIVYVPIENPLNLQQIFNYPEPITVGDVISPLNGTESSIVSSCFDTLRNLGISIETLKIPIEFLLAPKKENEFERLVDPQNRTIELPFWSDDHNGSPLYLIIYTFAAQNAPRKNLGGSQRSMHLTISDRCRRIDLIALKRESNPADMMRNFFHEFGHLLGFEHIPLSFSMMDPPCTIEPMNPDSLTRAILFANVMNCSSQYNPHGESGVMYCRLEEGGSNNFSLALSDQIAFFAQYSNLIKNDPATKTQNPIKAAPHTFGLRYRKAICPRNGRADVCEATPSYGDGRKIEPTKTLASELRRELTIEELKKDALRAFICAVTLSVVQRIISETKYSEAAKQRLEMAIDFAVTAIIYGIPVAVLGLGFDKASHWLKDYTQRYYPNKAWIIPYLKPLMPILISGLYKFWLEGQLLGAIKHAASLTLELAVNALSGLLGSYLSIDLINAAVIMREYMTKQKPD